MTKNGVHLKDFFGGVWVHIRRLILLERGVKDTGHAFTNIFVESCKLSAYHAGHLWMVQTLLTIIGIIYVLSFGSF